MNKIKIPHIDSFRPERNKLGAFQFLYSAIGKLSDSADGQVLDGKNVDISTIYDTGQQKYILNCEIGKYYYLSLFDDSHDNEIDIMLPKIIEYDEETEQLVVPDGVPEIGMISLMFKVPSSAITVNINSESSNINYISDVKLGNATAMCELNIFCCYGNYYINLINYDTVAQQLVLTKSD